MIRTFLSFCAIAFAIAAPAQAQSFSDAQKQEIQAVVKEYLLENPEALIEALNKYQEEQQAQMLVEQEAKIKENQSFLYNNPDSPAIGPENADVTVVEFFDYNCGYCKKAFIEVQKLIDSDKNVRVVFKEMPILSPSSAEAARWALAAHRQGKYFEFHKELMTTGGPKTEDTLKTIAKKVGLDLARLEKDQADPAIQALIDKNMEVSAELGIRGTPGFMIGDKLVPGYIDADQMKELVADQRKAKSDG